MKRNPKTVTAWCLYDWANSAFATTVMAALFPPFFRTLALRAGLSGSQATAYWGYITSTALALVALGAPALGAMADYAGSRKRFLAVFAGLGILATAASALIGAQAWRTAAAVFLCGSVGFTGANIFYESFLPHIASKADMDRISSRGYALGYLGGGLLLGLNTLWVARPHWFGIPGSEAAIRLSFLSVAVWWGVFTAPLLRFVPEPPVDRPSGTVQHTVRQGFLRVMGTLREIRRYRQLMLFLIAFWIYSDGIGTIIKMAAAFGHEIGIGIPHLAGALLLTQFVGFPCTLLLGRVAGTLGTKRTILLTLAAYALISMAGFFMRTAAHFYALAALVGIVQGGSQALSRSLFAGMIPPGRSAEFFGFFTTSSKFAGIAGPLLLGLIAQLTGNSRLSVLALVVFFVAGALLLCFVDEK